MTALASLTLLLHAALAPPALAAYYDTADFAAVAAHPRRQVAVQALPDGRWRVAGAGVVDGLAATSADATWPGVRRLRVRLYDPARQTWGGVLVLAALDCSQARDLADHAAWVRTVPGLGRVRGLVVEVNRELAKQYHFRRAGVTAVQVLGIDK